MKKIIIFILGISLWTSASLAEIIFKNCNLSPNYGVVNLTVYLEKNEIKLEEQSGVAKFLKINERNDIVISANGDNEQIDELFVIDIKNGIIRVTIKPSINANQTTKDLLKDKQAVTNVICEPENLYSKAEQQDQGVRVSADYERRVLEAQAICMNLGYRTDTAQMKDEMMVCVLHEMVKEKEKVLAAKAKAENDIEMSFSYETDAGEKINKESKWKKFWGAVNYIITEHGEEILNLAIDLKYGTNNSGYNTTDQVSSNMGDWRCVSQRLGKVVHQNCKRGSEHIYCMYQQIGKSVKRTCRDKSIR